MHKCCAWCTNADIAIKYIHLHVLVRDAYDNYIIASASISISESTTFYVSACYTTTATASPSCLLQELHRS
jgi:hypothetical protein